MIFVCDKYVNILNSIFYCESLQIWLLKLAVRIYKEYIKIFTFSKMLFIRPLFFKQTKTKSLRLGKFYKLINIYVKRKGESRGPHIWASPFIDPTNTNSLWIWSPCFLFNWTQQTTNKINTTLLLS